MTHIHRLAVFMILTTFIAIHSGQAVALDFHGSLGPERHHRYVSSLANPLLNETPYITTEVRPLYFHNRIPEGFLTDGGTIDVVAMQIRVALTERLGVIATKDGYANIDFDQTLPDEDGLANLGFGFKFALLSQPDTQTILTVGIEYEVPSGDFKTGGISLQGDGDGLFDLFVTGAKAFGKFGLQASAGLNLAIDQDHDSSQFHFSAHADYELLPGVFPLLEFNGFHTIDEGSRTAADFEGIDLVNFGSTDSGTVVNIAAGSRYKLNDHVQFGAGYETPITDREDLMDWRNYADLVLSY